MNLKNKIATNLSLLFSIFLGIILLFIYILFANFRKDEFKGILNDRISTVSNFIMVNRNDNLEDLNKINKTQTYIKQEHISVFDKDMTPIYSNAQGRKINWNNGDLKLLKEKCEIYRKKGDVEVYGKINLGNYYIIEAKDFIGMKKLEYLRNLMLMSFLIANALVWFISFGFAKGMISPLDDFQERITNISVNNLNEKLPETNKKDEINLLAKVFNTMLVRIQNSYEAQKEFTSSASHEIKTPLTRMAFQLENLSKITKDDEEKKYISGIQKEVYHLSDTVNSLLILSKIEENQNNYIEDVRMDEAVFEAFEIVKRSFPEFEINFKISEDNQEGNLTAKGVKSLLEIALINIFKNAVLYSSEPKADVEISENEKIIEIRVSSKGKPISQDEQKKIFEAFTRGSNSQNKTGSGLGLRISKRIMDFHHGEISYNTAEPDFNVFILKFPV